MMMTGCNNICIGRSAGANLTTGSFNILIGPEAGSDLTSECGVIEINGVRTVDLSGAEEIVPYLREVIRREAST